MEGDQFHQLDSLRRTFFDNYLDYRNDQVQFLTVQPGTVFMLGVYAHVVA